MARLRVHELAKELNMNNKDLLERLIKLGIQVKNHMSTLTDSAVQKIRQQFAESRAETVEEKRIGRTVIRRRKRTAEEGEAPAPEMVAEEHEEVGRPMEVPLAMEPIEEPEIEIPSIVAAPVSLAPPAVAETVPPLPEEVYEEPPIQPVQEVQPEPSLPLEEPEPAPVVALEPPSAELPPEPVRAAAPAVEEEPEVFEPVEPPAPIIVQPEAVPRVVPEKEPVPVAQAPAPAPETPPPAPKVSPPQVSAPPPVQEGEEPAEAEPEEEEEAAKAKKTKKRRRKKARKDEPARIIKLPEIIAEEPEEEPVIATISTRLQVKTEEPEAKEALRKKRTRPEEAGRDERKRRTAAAPPAKRKEVFQREDLYSKKELAAQADRARDRGRPMLREVARPEPSAPKIVRKPIKVDEAITVANISKQMGVKAGEVIKKLLILGLPANINQALDFDTAGLLASEFGYEVEKTGYEEEEILQVRQDSPEELLFRPPVVTVMGHVDHGKTSLLDAIRDTNVIGGEAGGITQHIGAYYVKLENGDVVFLDTPGHEAFTSMRARGAKVTDLVILVVAADDGVMQQTIEAINHAKAAQVPIVVAINKIDKPNANIDRVKRELADQGLISEEWGGDVTMVEISAKKRIGINDLLEMVLLQSEILELKANPSKPARGHVIEAKLDKGRGPVATILIQEGTLNAGDMYVCGVHSGKVRNMFNDRGQRLESAGPSMPVEVLGLSGVPNAGDDFIVLPDEKQAKLVAEHRLAKVREKELTRTTKVTLESLFEQIQVGEIKELNLILKTDVHGSLEAIADSLRKLSTPEVKVNLIHTATGAITETDVLLASASNAIILGFNVRAEAKVQELIEQERVDMRYYDVIYQLLSDVRDAMEGMLEPIYQENVLGRAEVRQTFHVPKIGTVAGCYVVDGRIERNARVRVLRDNVVIYDGKFGSLKRFKDDVKEVKTGFECGIGVENFNDIKVGDFLEAYELQAVKATLSTTTDEK